jgi:hypothetical protein
MEANQVLLLMDGARVRFNPAASSSWSVGFFRAFLFPISPRQVHLNKYYYKVGSRMLNFDINNNNNETVAQGCLPKVQHW